ncbi:hypothetical protein TRFO_21235 [Tritrichomonas foetus]|uniref:Mon2/Sec7/BIG1-like HDS domain-containing protein n=1 Tax=Tritrichomonas foetus TaxID=1144522 RepID=A0A1J4KK51_9EUKA|nr:hypothetical protein TRFO_21235 [Tritrichomonas foetus]|eukprot:OHT09725.1 hypothetical protein TRFO_21235 [Tritrichomonas foetus]
MQFKYLADLKCEFKKFTGFMTPDIISEPSAKSIAFLSDPNMCLPIEDASVPIVAAFSVILNSKKQMKSWAPLISSMCSCVSSEAITGEALHKIVESMENVACEVEYDSGLRIIQFATSSITSRFLEIPIFQAILSLVLAFCSSKDKSLHTAAFAAVRQILNSFIVFAKSSSDSLSPVNKRDIDGCFEMTCETTITFESPLNRIIYLILRDLSRMCNGEDAVWIHSHDITTNTAFGILESIILQHSDLLISSPHFLQLIEVSMIAAEKNAAPLSFSVACMDNFLEAMPQQCASHFNSFLTKMKRRSSTWISSLQFFRIFLLKRNDIIFRFYKNCDPTVKLLYKLIQKMLEFSDILVNQENIELSMNPIGFDPPGEMFKCSAPVEIAVYFVQACLNSDPSIKTLVSAIWKDILVIISVSMTSVVDHSCYILMQNLHLLVELSYSLELEEARGAVIAAFCTVLMSKHSEIRKNAFNTLTYAIQSTPVDFNNHWYKILTTLAEFQWQPTSLDFTTTLDIGALEEFTSSLISIHNSGKAARAWSLNLFSDVLVVNSNRFNELWPSVNDKLLPLFDNESSYEPAVSCLSNFIGKCMNEETELQLCQFIYDIILKAPISRRSILEIIKTLVAQQGQTIKKGWNQIISSLSPKNYTSSDKNHQNKDQLIDKKSNLSQNNLYNNNLHNNIQSNNNSQGQINHSKSNNSISNINDHENEVNNDQVLIELGFQALQVICNDVMFILNETLQQSIISLIFEYAGQTIDQNVCLSAFNSLWNVIPLAKTSSMWKLIFSLCVPLIDDDRNDVSLCAVKTFFSIITSNASAIPSDVFEFLANTCFNQIIDMFINKKSNKDSTHQLCFQEMAHCSRSLWNELSEQEEFSNVFWPKMVDQHLNFMLNCEKREALILAFQFYEETFQCFKLSNSVKHQVFDTLDKLATFLISKEPAKSSLFGAFGRLILMTLPTQKDNISDEFLARWISLINKLILEIDCGSFLPPTTHKSLDAILTIFPLPQNQAEMVYKALVDLSVNENKNIRLTEVALSHILELFDTEKVNSSYFPYLFVMSEELFSMKEAEPILNLFVEKEMEITDNMVEKVAHSLIQLGKLNENMTLKTGLALSKLFLRLKDETKIEFIDAQANSFIIQQKVWSEYLHPDNENFHEKSAILCTKIIAKHIGEQLNVCTTDFELNERLQFLKDVKSSPKAFGEDKIGDHRHINFLIPIFADLVLHPSEEIRKILRFIFLLLNEE